MKLLWISFQSLKLYQNMSYYAVARGHKVGIYETWSQCQKQVNQFKGAKYKKFPTREEAENFIQTVNGTTDFVSNRTQFAPEDVAVPLGSKTGAEWKEKPQKALEKPSVQEFWPENEENNIDEAITDAELLSALVEVEGIPEESSKPSSSSSSKLKRKAEEPLITKKPKHQHKIWEPIGMKKVGGYEFLIDSEGFVIVYTDGSCINNGRPDAVAGFGVYFGENHSLNAARPVCGRVTNNAGEIQAAIYAIKTAKDLGIDKLCLSTDSQFLINAVTEWISFWKRNGWRLKSGGPVKNEDDFKQLDKLLHDEAISVKWNYVKAHSGYEGNEMADKLAREGSEIYRRRKLKT